MKSHKHRNLNTLKVGDFIVREGKVTSITRWAGGIGYTVQGVHGLTAYKVTNQDYIFTVLDSEPSMQDWIDTP